MDATLVVFIPGPALHIRPIRLHIPDAALVVELEIKRLPQPGLQGLVFNRGDNFDARFKVACHYVGRTDKIFLFTAVFEIEDAGMFKEPADDGDHFDILRKAGDTRPQAAGVTNNKINMHSGLGSLVERFGNIFVFQGIGFELDQAGIFRGVLFNVPLGEWEKIPRLQAKTLVGLRYYEKISQNLP